MLIALSGAHAANAAPPATSERHFDLVDAVAATCDGYTVLASASVDIVETIYIDRSGSPSRVSVRISSVGKLTNSVTAFTVRDSAHYTVTTDLATGEERVAGVYFQITVPGEGTMVVDVGMITLDANGIPVAINGPHIPPPARAAALCAALDF